MNRRQFLALGPAFPAAAVTGSLVVREEAKEPISLDTQVLKIQSGDILVLRSKEPIDDEMARMLTVFVEHQYPGVRAMVLGPDITIEGVLRT